ncbi:MAG: haloacid dehalogenase-like hydrolase, partial [Opitutaceae bacterium]|nr:haloacid dehalogenase-like hydrolase [Opitutaceae bacterium]
MPTTLFTQNTIACIWDFDKTLIPGYMQAPLFRRHGVDESVFWAETNALVENYRKR